jgi:hypothetical protein
MPEIIEGISGDLGNHLFGCTWIPGQTAQWDMT